MSTRKMQRRLDTLMGCLVASRATPGAVAWAMREASNMPFDGRQVGFSIGQGKLELVAFNEGREVQRARCPIDPAVQSSKEKSDGDADDGC